MGDTEAVDRELKIFLTTAFLLLQNTSLLTIKDKLLMV